MVRILRSTNHLFPFIILSSLIFTLPFGGGTSENNAILIVQSMIIALSLFSLVMFRKKGEAEFHLFEALFLVLIAFCFSGYFYSSYPYATLLSSLDLLFGFILYLAVRRFLSGEKGSISIIFLLILIVSLIEGVIALRQYFVLNLDRASGSFINPNHLASLINISLGVVIALLFSGKKGKRTNVLLGGIGGFLFFILLLTKSRGGFLSFLFILALIAFLKGKKRTLIALFLILLAVVLIPNPLRDHLIKRYDIYAFTRIDIWRMSLRMFFDHPLLGVGLGNFKIAAEPYNFPVAEAIGRYAKIPRQAHNSFLEFTVETGAIGGALLIVALFLLFREVKGFVRKNDTPPYTFAPILSLSAVLFQAFFSSIFRSRGVLYLTFILIAILASQTKGGRNLNLRLSNGKILLLYGVIFYLPLFVLGSLLPFIGERYYREGLLKVEKGEIVSGSALLRQAVRIIPIQPYYRAALADLYLSYFRKRGSIEAFYYALLSYNQAERLSPADPRFIIGRINCYLALLEKGFTTEEAYRLLEAEYKRALSLRPYDVFLLRGLAYLYIDLRKYSLAEDTLKKAISLEPNYIAGHYDLGKLYLLLGRVEEGKKEMKKAEEIARKYESLRDSSPYLRELLAQPKTLFKKEQ